MSNWNAGFTFCLAMWGFSNFLTHTNNIVSAFGAIFTICLAFHANRRYIKQFNKIVDSLNIEEKHKELLRK